jgi:hypothetical protein
MNTTTAAAAAHDTPFFALNNSRIDSSFLPLYLSLAYGW